MGPCRWMDKRDETRLDENSEKQNRCENLEQLHNVENEGWTGLAQAPGHPCWTV